MSDNSQSFVDWLKSLLTAGSRLWPLGLLLIVAVGLVAVWPWAMRLPIWPLKTEGRIFVESPEVYTRERLVNDRYEQAFWLEQQLEKLDQSSNFTTARRELAIQMAFDPTAEAKITALPELSALPFEHEYQIRSALRARIRQSLLENQLDDRHDLTGNSVYGLKFDTSVIPGSNTHDRAYVRVKVSTPDLPNADLLPTLLSKSLEDVRRDGVGGFGASEESTTQGNQPSDSARDFPEHYENWIETIEGSLNSYLDDISDISAAPGGSVKNTSASTKAWVCQTSTLGVEDKRLTTEILAESLSKVLAIDERSVYFPDKLFPDQNRASYGQVEINLPSPWNRYITITVADSKKCLNWKHFKVAPLRQYLLVVPDTAASAATDEQFQKLYFQVAAQSLEENGNKTDYSVYAARSGSGGESKWPTREEVERLQLQFQLDEISLKQILNHRNAYPVCINPFGGAVNDDCKAPGQSVIVDVGMYNFARGILESDYYLYTVFPKTDVSGVLERSLVTSSLGLNLGGKSGGIASTEAEMASRLVPSQLSFADEVPTGEIVFGWVVGTAGVQQAVQKSQFVLLSLPAYLKRLNLEIETGWLDRNSKFHPQKSEIPMKVALPPDYEAFDTLIRGSKSHGPAIFDRLMEEIKLHSCRSASILIPGARLWRSTLVTLGGHQADQIIVMPDMRGIIARFEQVPQMESGPALLQLWTSEGSDRIDNKVSIIAHEDGDCPSLQIESGLEVLEIAPKESTEETPPTSETSTAPKEEKTSGNDDT